MLSASKVIVRLLAVLCSVAILASTVVPVLAAPLPRNSILSAPVVVANPLTDDAPATAAENIRRTIERTVADVASAVAAQPGGDTPVVAREPEWARFTAGNAEIWLPESFEGGDLRQDLDVILNLMRNQGPDYAAMADLIEQNPSAFLLWAADTDNIESGVLTNVNIVTESVLSVIDTEAYLDAVEGMLPAGFDTLERARLALPEFEDASRLISYVKLPGAPPMKQAMYVIKDGTTVWTVTFTVHESAFESWLPIFQRSIESFSVSPD